MNKYVKHQLNLKRKRVSKVKAKLGIVDKDVKLNNPSNLPPSKVVTEENDDVEESELSLGASAAHSAVGQIVDDKLKLSKSDVQQIRFFRWPSTR